MNQLIAAARQERVPGHGLRPAGVADYGEPVERRVTAVPLATLLPGDSIRSQGPDEEHVARLAESEAPLPPILVERHTMKVVDGVHRLLAASLKGQRTIDVVFFDGPAEDVYLYAVAVNVTHGLPLSLADRKAAAARIVTSHPHLSDRAIARAAGLGAKAVAAIRRETAGDGPHGGHMRVGRDGKVRPLNSAEGRLRAFEVLTARPEASLREVARIAGISPATVSDVRKRMAAGLTLPPESASRTHPGTLTGTDTVGSAGPVDTAGTPGTPGTANGPRAADSCAPRDTNLGKHAPRGRQPREQADAVVILEKLLRDPSLRQKEEGRNLLRLLQQNAIGMREWDELAEAVPPHCGALVVDLARQYAKTWVGFAQELDQRVQAMTQA